MTAHCCATGPADSMWRRDVLVAWWEQQWPPAGRVRGQVYHVTDEELELLVGEIHWHETDAEAIAAARLEGSESRWTR